MKKFQNVHKANEALPKLGEGERIMVGSSSYRVADVYGAKALKATDTSVGEAGIGFIPGERYFNRTAGNGKSTSDR